MLRNVYAVLVVLLAVAQVHAQAQPGLVAHYDFEEGKGEVARDRSGHGNHGKLVGGVRWVKGGFGTALELDGRDGYVDGGADESLNIASGGTIMVWCYPRTIQGGLVNWMTGTGWNDARLAMAVDTYHVGRRPLGVVADGENHSDFNLGKLQPNVWNHIAVTFDGKKVRVYNDGFLVSRRSQALKPKIAGVPMWVGKCLGMGKDIFHGLLDEVRVYNRALSAREIANHYRDEGARRGKDLDAFKRLVVSAFAQAPSGRILVEVDARAVQFVHDVARVRLVLSPGGKTVAITELPEGAPSQAVFNVKDLPPGEYTIRAVAFNSQDKRAGEDGEAAVKWPGVPEAFKNVKILNNLCWELLAMEGDQRIRANERFTLPIDRWIFIRTRAQAPAGGEVRVAIENDPIGRPATIHTRSGTLEAMRYLKAGTYTLTVSREGGAAIKHLTVRAIPALQHAFYCPSVLPHIAAYGPYDWAFLQKHILPHVNVLIGARSPKDEHIRSWKQMGRKWIRIAGMRIPEFNDEAADAVDKAFKYWSSSPGYQHPLMDGIIVDEFRGGDSPAFDAYRKAVERLNATFPGRIYMPYISGGLYGRDKSTEFAKAAIAGGGYVCPERYLSEQPSEQDARSLIRETVLGEMSKWEKGMPGVLPRLVVVLGYMSLDESLNVNPSVNFKVYMDLQVRGLATNPACFGLGGIQWYQSSYCSEEEVRWAAHLLRHYCIEGRTEPATKDPYRLTHVQNPDFADETKGWTISPAEPGSIRAGELAGYSSLQGRSPKTSMGDTFLRMKRSGKKVNVVSQQIRNLTPGRLYAMKTISGDYQDLVREESEKKSHGLSIKLENVDLLSGPRKHFDHVFHNNYSHVLGKFTGEHYYWMTWHWRVFRAKAKTAKLTITDWESEDKPGGPIGQELMFNFVEVQPYFE